MYLSDFQDIMDVDLPQRKAKHNKAPYTVITLDLFKPGDTTYPEFDYEEIRKDQLGEDDSSGEDERFHDKEALMMVRQLEAKYGNNKTKNGKKVCFGNEDDYIDKTAGYDLEDDFIDDSEAYDELIPSSMDTRKGGFYLNKGKLDFTLRREELDDSDISDEEIQSTSVPKTLKKSRLTAVLNDQAADGVPVAHQSSPSCMQQTTSDSEGFTRLVGAPPTKRFMGKKRCNLGHIAAKLIKRKRLTKIGTNTTPEQNQEKIERAVKSNEEPSTSKDVHIVSLEPSTTCVAVQCQNFTSSETEELKLTLSGLKLRGVDVSDVMNLIKPSNQSISTAGEDIVPGKESSNASVSPSVIDPNMDIPSCSLLVSSCYTDAGDVVPKIPTPSNSEITIINTSVPVKPKIKFTLGQYIEKEKHERVPEFPRIPWKDALATFGNELASLQSVIETLVNAAQKSFEARTAQCLNDGKAAPSKPILQFTDSFHTAVKSYLAAFWQVLSSRPLEDFPPKMDDAITAAAVLETQILPNFGNLIGLGRLCLEICRRNPDNYMILRTPKTKEALKSESINPNIATIVGKGLVTKSPPSVNESVATSNVNEDEVLIVFEKPTGTLSRTTMLTDQQGADITDVPGFNSDQIKQRSVMKETQELAVFQNRKKIVKTVKSTTVPSTAKGTHTASEGVSSTCEHSLPQNPPLLTGIVRADVSSVRGLTNNQAVPAKPKMKFTLKQFMENEKHERVPEFPRIPINDANTAFYKELASLETVVKTLVSAAQKSFETRTAQSLKDGKTAPSKPILQFTVSFHAAVKSFLAAFWQVVSSRTSETLSPKMDDAISAAEVLETAILPHFDKLVGLGRLCREICRRSPDNYMILRTPKVMEALKSERINPETVTIVGEWLDNRAASVSKSVATSSENENEVQIVFEKHAGK